MQSFAFDPEPHVYRLAGERLPSVTEVLSETGITRDHSHTDPFYRDRGSAVHKAIALEVMGQLDHDSLDGHTLPYVEAFREFYTLLGLTPLVVERPMFCEVYHYAGTGDFLGTDKAGDLWILDWKSGAFERGHEIQVAGGYLPLYEQSAERLEIPVDRAEVTGARLGVVSLAGGKARLHKLESNGQRDVFRAALAVYRWRTGK